ncbi:MAG: transcription termination factor Rho [Opitutales bacterium]
MQDDLNIPDNNTENPAPKKRGRPAKTAKPVAKRATVKRARRTKKDIEDTSREEISQSYDLDLDDNSSNDSEQDAPVYASIDIDEDVPMSFSTSDDDLVQDNYKDDYSDEDDFVVVKTQSDNYDIAADMEEQIEAEQAEGDYKQNNRNNRNDRNDRNNRNNRNQNKNHQNNRQQNDRNNRRQGDNQGDRQNQNNRNNRNNQNQQNNRNQNNRQQNNRQNQNQQNNQNNRQQNQNNQQKQNVKATPKPSWQNPKDRGETSLDIGELQKWQILKSIAETKNYLSENFDRENIVEFEEYYTLNTKELQEKLAGEELPFSIKNQSKYSLLAKLLAHFGSQRRLVRIEGVLDLFEKSYGGVLCFARDNFQLKRFCPWLSPKLIEEYGLKRGHNISVLCCPPREDEEFTEKCPIALEVERIMDKAPEDLKGVTPFNDLTAYYPTERMIMECVPAKEWDNLSMRAVDLLTPIGLGQRALIVAPPRTGKTVLMQSMAMSIRENTPQAKVIILLVDERPEEVTDFKRNVDAMVIASTFDQDSESHIHACEMVISKARRLVEMGDDVVILLDSITRMARAYNTMAASSGKIMSGGVESNALQKPKRFFGSARNVEGGGSLTIIGTALVETGSKMDEVIFEEFKGTGNMEINLDRSLVDKRIFPAMNIEKSGTRKEELLYHPDEMQKIYALRRAMKAITNTEAMEMLVQRLRKTRTNIDFLMGLNR